MGNIEKKIATTGMWGIAAIVGFRCAEYVYTKGMAGYMKLFHKDEWNKAVKQVLEKDLA